MTYRSLLKWFFLFFVISVAESNESRPLKIPLKGLGQNLFVTEIGIGTPLQHFKNFGYDITAKYSYVQGKDCKSCVGKTFQSEKSGTLIRNGTIKVEEYAYGLIGGSFQQDVINFGGLATVHNNFILTDKINNKTRTSQLEGVLGFGMSYSDEEKNSSIIDKVVRKLQFGKRVFSQKIFNDTSGELVVGQLPREIFSSVKTYEKCSTLHEDNRWACMLTDLKIGNEFIMRNATPIKAYFSTLYSKVLAPASFFEAFSKFYFREHFQFCLTKKSSKDGRQLSILCNTSVLDHLDQIEIVIDNASFLFPTKSLFSTTGEGLLEFQIGFHHNIRNWYFGQSFLKNFLVVFDAENREVGFYGDGITSFARIELYLWLYFAMIPIAVTVFFLAAFLVMKRKERLAEMGEKPAGRDRLVEASNSI